MIATKFPRLLPRLEGVICLIAAFFLLIQGETVHTGVAKGLELCGRILIPSLFPFMVLAAFWSQRQNTSSRPSVFSRLLAFPPNYLPAVFLGLIGGYPVCAQCVRSLDRQERSSRFSQDLLQSCTSAGPAFVLTAVGCGMLQRPDLGVRLYFCHLAGSVFLLLPGWKARRNLLAGEPFRTEGGTAPSTSFSACLVDSVSSAIHGVLTMCGFVLLFSGAGNLLTQGLSAILSDPSLPQRVLLSVLEVTAGVTTCVAQGDLPLLVFALGWGGCSVQFQIFALLRNSRVAVGKFLLARLLHGLFSAGCFLLWDGISPLVQTTFLTSASPLHPSFFAGIPGCAALLFSCAVFLLTLPARTQKTIDRRRHSMVK